MHKRLKSLEGVEFFENEVVGPEIIGMLECEQDDRYGFYGAIIPTTHRLLIRMVYNEDDVQTRYVMYRDISGISRENLPLAGTYIHVWTGNKIEISMKSIPDGKLKKFLDFIYKYRSRELRIDSVVHSSEKEKAV